jgi:hypothetical protein
MRPEASASWNFALCQRYSSWVSSFSSCSSSMSISRSCCNGVHSFHLPPDARGQLLCHSTDITKQPGSASPTTGSLGRDHRPGDSSGSRRRPLTPRIHATPMVSRGDDGTGRRRSRSPASGSRHLPCPIVDLDAFSRCLSQIRTRPRRKRATVAKTDGDLRKCQGYTGSRDGKALA